MFNHDIKRVGFACKYHHPDQTLARRDLDQLQRKFNGRTTSIAWLNRNQGQAATDRLFEISDFNVDCFDRLVRFAASREPELRMVRLSSDVLVAYTHPDFQEFWQDPSTQAHFQKRFAALGDLIRELDVRVSMHPGQFTVLASDRSEVVEASIIEFEYHATLARWMGFGAEFQDMKINVHISGRQGPDGIRKVLPRLSPEARNSITLENEENAWGLDAVLELADLVPVVLDIHHHWVREGEYIQPGDDRVKQVIDSWRGVRPVMHYSVSREDYLVDADFDILPDMNILLETGFKKNKLRAHSDMMWNSAVNHWAAEFNETFDIMIEAKHKNLAAETFFRKFVKST